MTTVTVTTPLGVVERELEDWEKKEQNLPDGLFSRILSQGFTGRAAHTSADVFVPPTLAHNSLLSVR